MSRIAHQGSGSLDEYQKMPPDEFYAMNKDIAPFDNGSGLFVLAGNKNVTLSEIAAYGHDQLAIYDETGALLKAAQNLVSKLGNKSPLFVKYFIGEVLDDDAAALVLAAGAVKLLADSQEVKPYTFPYGCSQRLKETHGCGYVPLHSLPSNWGR